MRTHSSVALPAVVLAGIWTAACSSSNGSPASASGGAIIQGTIESGSAGSASFTSSGSAGSSTVHVSVEGTEISATSDSQGRFTLGGVPAGAATLRFQGSGVDARLKLDGLVEGQVLTIAVSIAGSSAQLVPTTGIDDEVELTGVVESVSPPTLVVSGTTVTVSTTTEIRRGDSHIALADVQPGERVKVEGSRQLNGVVAAREIEVLAPSTSQVTFAGTIQALQPPRLVVAGRAVLTDSNTKFSGQGRTHSLADFAVGDTVEVTSSLSASSTVLASEIKRLSQGKGNDDNDDDDDDQGDDDQGDDDQGGDNDFVGGR